MNKMNYPQNIISNFCNNIQLPKDLQNECWIYTGTTTNGYGAFYDGNRTIQAHRFSYEYYNGPIPIGYDTRHMCHNRCCISPYHLTIGTRQDNIDDKVLAGRQAKGIDIGISKLTDGLIQEIFQRVDNGESVCELANYYNVNKTTLYAILNRKTWKHVEKVFIPNLTPVTKKVSRIKLNKNNVRDIRYRLSINEDIKNISIIYNVSVQTIQLIKNGKIWKNVV